MSHIYRFYSQFLSEDGSRVVLRDDEAHHALNVLRIKVGQDVHVFDGEGLSWRCVVEEVSRKEVMCGIVDTRKTERSVPGVCVSLAWLNKDKSVEELIQRCTELGVSEFRFFRGDHSGRAPKENKKWAKWAIEACKQCGRVWVPEFVMVEDLIDVVCDEETCLVASLGETSVPLKEAVSGTGDINILVGPEGDFSERELALVIRHGGKPVSLGDAVYRSQVAASVMTTLVLNELGRMGSTAK